MLGGIFYLDWLAVGLEMAVADLLICGFADLLICWVVDLRMADLQICGFAGLLGGGLLGGIIPNFLLLLTLRKFILFGDKGELNVR